MRRKVIEKTEAIGDSRLSYATEPRSMSNGEYSLQLTRELIRRQKALDKLRLEENEVKIRVNDDEPMIGMHLSDIHFGSSEVNYEEVLALLDFALEQENIMVNFYGDLADGLKIDHLDTIVMQSMADTSQQLIGFRELFIRPLVQQGKVGAMVSAFKSHEEWLREYSGFNPYAVLADLQEDKVAVIRNGGLLHLVHPDGEVEVWAMFHTTGGGSNGKNPLSGPKRAANTYLADEVRMVVQGHHHSQQAALRLKDANDFTRVFITMGSVKGRKPRTSAHSVRDYGGQSAAPEGYYTIHAEYDDDHQIYPVPTMEHAELFYQAAQLMYWALKNGDDAVQDLLEKIYSQVERRPSIKFMRNKSKVRQSDNETSKNWTDLAYRVDTNLPYTQIAVANARLGSTTAETKRLREVVGTVADHPRMQAILLRQMVDMAVPASADREKIVAQLVEILAPIANSPDAINTLLILFDSILRREDWKRPTKRNRLGRKTGEDAEGFFAGDTLTDALNVPLIDNQGNLIIYQKADGSGMVRHNVKILDGSARSGSYEDGTQSLVAQEERQPERSNVVLGGDDPNGGILTKHNHKMDAYQTFISPGSLSSEHNKGGKRNRGRPTQGPMGALYIPADRTVHGMTSLEEAHYWTDAMTLLFGSRALGQYEEWLNRLKTTKGKRR